MLAQVIDDAVVAIDAGERLAARHEARVAILMLARGGDEDDVMGATNEKLNDLVFASDLFKRVKEVEMNKLKQL